MLEDIALMRALPNMYVYTASTDIITKNVIENIAKDQNPSYVRLYRMETEEHYEKLTKEEIETCLKNGMLVKGIPGVELENHDIIIVTMGDMIDIVYNVQKRLKEEYEIIKNSYYELEEVDIVISKMSDGEYDEKRLRKLESRIDEYVTLKRKYGKTVGDIFKFLAETKERLDEIEHKDERLEELSKEKQKLEQELDILAERMFQLRKKAGKDISDKINEGLKDLEMKNAEFSILVEKRDKFTKEGKDYIEFMIRTNKGEEQKELKKIASGGEMSRIMLSIKNILRRSR